MKQKVDFFLKKLFSNLVQNLVSKLPPSPNIFTESKVASYYDNIDFKNSSFPFSKFKIEFKVLTHLRHLASITYLELSLNFQKMMVISQQDQYLNFTISLSNLIRSIKIVVIAKMKPLFTKGSKIDPQNYQLISLLALLSKLIERVADGQTQEFLSENKILFTFQSGFRRNYSTNTGLGHLTDKITFDFQKGCLME